MISCDILVILNISEASSSSHCRQYQILWDLYGFTNPIEEPHSWPLLFKTPSTCSNQMQWWWRWPFACYIHPWIKQYRQHVVAYCWAQRQQHRLHPQSRPAGRCCCQKHEHDLCSVLEKRSKGSSMESKAGKKSKWHLQVPVKSLAYHSSCFTDCKTVEHRKTLM